MFQYYTVGYIAYLSVAMPWHTINIKFSLLQNFVGCRDLRTFNEKCLCFVMKYCVLNMIVLNYTSSSLRGTLDKEDG